MSLGPFASREDVLRELGRMHVEEDAFKLTKHEILTLADGLRARGVKGFTGFGVEFIFSDTPPAAEKPPEAPPAEGNMPTRAEIEETKNRLSQGAK